MPSGHDPIKRYLINLLSHGERRPTEIKSIARDTRWNQRVVVNKLREVESSTELIEKHEDGGATYYSLADSTKTESLKPAADPGEVSSLLTQMELQLGLKDRNVSSLPTDQQELTLPEVLAGLNTTIQTRKHVFNQDDELLTRFFEIFDVFVDMVARSFHEGTNETATTTLLSIPTMHQFFHLVHSLNREWKSGNVLMEFNQELRRREDDMVALLRDVPPELGVRIHAIGVSLDFEVSREMVKAMISTGDYSSSHLLRAIEKTYLSTGNTQVLFADLSLEGSLNSSEQISEVVDGLREQFRNSDGDLNNN